MEGHRDRLEELLRAYGPGSRPASHGRYALVGQPETLVILERMEAVPFLLHGRWEEELVALFTSREASCSWVWETPRSTDG
ncbi:hypothetical protein [Streptomyces sp. TP-A0874]|uniref:hypothetical protein n=1 Tax=Streptomyces sp. TP-A0874 TaxID=549819 RepID=UPI000852D1C6|nr:hypothetical protein [Streptomyces sp. TP-A0874]